MNVEVVEDYWYVLSSLRWKGKGEKMYIKMNRRDLGEIKFNLYSP